MTPEEVQMIVKDQPCLLPRGGGSKPALSTPPEGVPVLEMSGMAGVLEYEPAEYTFTALAGTPVAEVEALLAQHGQYLPFDPLLAERGATLGGTVAAGVSGPGRQRYGGVRDFLMGVRFVDGQGQLVRGGGKVVKNSAGFDLPKLMVGSLGRLGVLVELSFKVFPGPEAYATLRLAYATLEAAIADIYRLNMSPLELHGLDLEPADSKTEAGWTLWVRLGGLTEALPARLERLRNFLLAPTGGGREAEVMVGASEEKVWQGVKAFDWVPANWALAKIPLTPKRIAELEGALAGLETRRRYSAGGQMVWLAWPWAGGSSQWSVVSGQLPVGQEQETIAQAGQENMEAVLNRLGLAGLLLFGPVGQALLGVQPGQAFVRRAKEALDPAGRFLEVGGR